MAEKKRFWISWYQKTEDYRPKTFPPNGAILGWWCTGYADDGATICALVSATSLEEAWKAVTLDWPEEERKFRFENEVDDSYDPGDRFPLSDWMIPRFQQEANGQQD